MSLTTCFVGHFIEQSAKRFFDKCQRCKLKKGEPHHDCEFVGCDDKRKESEVFCSEVESICSINFIFDNTYLKVFAKIMSSDFELITFYFSLQIIV